MSSGKALVDAAIDVYDGIDSQDAQNTNRRRRLLSFLQQVYNLAWNFRPWSFTYKEGALIVWAANSNSVARPADFLEFGPNGSLFDPDRKIRFKEKTSYIVERVRNEMATNYDNYPFFALYNGAIQFPYTATSNINLQPFYRMKPETVTDDMTALVFPDEYAMTVLLPGLVYRGQLSKQDERQAWAEMWKEGLSQMASIENPAKTMTHRMPLAVRRAW